MATASSPHILFVDNEPSTLTTLSRMMRTRQDIWQLSYANDADEALGIMANRPCDVIITDYRLSDVDGGMLLEMVRDRYPSTARFVLSDHADEGSLLKVVLLAHHCLAKPGTQDELIEAIERVLTLRTGLPDEELAREIVGLNVLPSPPYALIELFGVLNSDDVSAAQVAKIIERDPAATAKVLQVVNSASVGVRRRITDVRQAVALLGVRNIRALVLMHDLVCTFSAEGAISPELMDRFTAHGVQTSRLARRLALGAPWGEDAFVAGLLHEIGLLVLAWCRHEGYATCLAEWAGSDEPLSTAERRSLGVDHASIGAYLLGLWGIPVTVIEAVAGHLAVPDGIDRPMDPTAAVALAHTLVEAELGALCGAPHGGTPDEAAPAADETRLAPPIQHEIELWREECRRNAADDE